MARTNDPDYELLVLAVDADNERVVHHVHVREEFAIVEQRTA
jgi:hypothetical protein